MLFVTGPHAAGKTHAARIFERLGFQSIDLGPTIRRLHVESGTSLSLHEWVSHNETEEGADFTDRILSEEVRKLSLASSRFLILGSRSYNNINYISDYVPFSPSERFILFVTAPYELLKKRWELREDRTISDEDFKRLLKRDEDMGVEEIRAHADLVISNDSSPEVFEAQIVSLAQRNI